MCKRLISRSKLIFTTFSKGDLFKYRYLFLVLIPSKYLYNVIFINMNTIIFVYIKMTILHILIYSNKYKSKHLNDSTAVHSQRYLRSAFCYLLIIQNENLEKKVAWNQLRNVYEGESFITNQLTILINIYFQFFHRILIFF